MENLLTVTQAAKLLGLKPASPPYHDAALKPFRTPGGARRYDPKQVARYAKQAQQRKVKPPTFDQLMDNIYAVLRGEA